MDYQLFCIRVSGGVFGRLNKGTLRILRVFESCISISNLAAQNEAATSVEYMFENISNVLPSIKEENELSLNVPDGTGKGYETLHIFCESRSELITTLLNKMDELNGIGTDFVLKKHSHERGELVERVLRVRSASIVKMQSTGLRHERRRVNPAKMFNFTDIVKAQTLSDDEHIVLLYLNCRMLRLSLTDPTPFLLAVSRNMKFYLNRNLQIEKIDTSTMVDNIAVYLKQLKSLPMLFEFQVLKYSEAKGQERKRTLYLSQEHFIEMAGEEIVAIHSLNDVIGIVVNDKKSNEVVVEFKSSRPTQYTIDERDYFIASIADAVGTARTSQFDVRSVHLFRHMLPQPDRSPYQLDYESYCLSRFMSEVTGNRDPAVLHIILKEFASNVHIGKSQCNDIRVLCAVAELLKDWNQHQDFVRSTTCCIVVSRLLGSRYCFESLKSITNLIPVLLQCMRSENAVLVYTAMVALKFTFKFSGEVYPSDSSLSKQEQANKLFVLSMENMQHFATILHNYCLRKGHVLQSYGMVKLLITGFENLSLETDVLRTWLKAFESSIMAIGDVLCVFSRCEKAILRESTAILLDAILSKTSSLVTTHFRTLALKRCLPIVHLHNALFSKTDLSQARSARLLFQMMDGNGEYIRLLQSLLPKGAFHIFHVGNFKTDKSINFFSSWIKLIEVLRRDTYETPLFVWNDMKRAQLQKFLEQELQGFLAAASANHLMNYDSADTSLIYTTESDGQGTVVGNVHLELLVDHQPPADELRASFWEVRDPLALFQAVFQALLLGFTPFFGHNNTPEVDLRLGVHVLTWIYQRYAADVSFSLQSSSVIEASVGMLQEVIETEHQVFVFKLVVFLLTLMEIGGRENVLRFVRAGGTTALVSLLVFSLAQCCSDRTEFESDGWHSEKSNSLETVQVVGLNGETRLARVPSGKVREVLDKAVVNGTLDAKEAIKWQDPTVPSKIQFGMALDVLEALLRISGSENNNESFPPSAACLSLSREEIMCHLVQSLLRAKTPAFGRILNIISHLIRMNRSARLNLHKLGTFEILLWKLLAGDIVHLDKRMIAMFLCQAHIPQMSESHIHENECSPCHKSFLRFYLPEGLIMKLISEDPDSFLLLLRSEDNSPEVVWNMDMVERLASHLFCQLQPYVRSRAADPMALYIHAPRPLIYEELAGTVFSAPFYLHNLLDTERFPNYPIKDPVNFLTNLMKDLRKLACDFTQLASSGSFWRKEITKIKFLISSLAYLLERFPKLSPPHDLETVVLTLATPALRSNAVSYQEDEILVFDIMLQTTKVLRRICIVTFRETEVLRESVKFGLSILHLGTRLKHDGTFPESITGPLELVIAGALLMLEVICRSRAGRELLQNDVRWKKGLWWALCAAAGDAASNVPTGPSPVSFTALDCLRHFINNGESLGIFEQGLHLPLLLLTFSTANGNVSGCKPALLYSAADVLKCLVDKDSDSLIRSIIPEPLVQCLSDVEGPEQFLTMAASDIARPNALWNGKVREEFRTRLYERLCYRGNVVANDEAEDLGEVEWLREFKYNALDDELVIDGVYINGLTGCNLESIDFVLESSMIESMMDFLLLHRNVASSVDLADGALGMGDRDRDRKVSFQEYISVLTALERSIPYALKMNKEDTLMECSCTILSSLVLQGKLDSSVQIKIVSISKVLVNTGPMVDFIAQTQLMEALSVLLWEAAAESSKEGMEDILRCVLEVLHQLSERIHATIAATNYFSAHGTLLPLMALFCDVNLPVLRGSASPGSKTAPRSFEHRLISAKILGQLLLAAKGVSRRAKLIEDLEKRKREADEGLDQATDMYELFSIVEHTGEEPKLVKSLMLLLPLELLSALARHPSEACKLYDGCFSSPKLVWDEARRHQLKTLIIRETARIKTLVNGKAICGLPPWTLDAKRPVFLRWTLVLMTETDKRPSYRQDQAEDYAQELYLGGFYVDQFLRNFKYALDVVMQKRLLHELRTALLIGKSADGLYAEAFNFDDRRRLLLALLFLLKLHPHLLSSRSNIDIFLPLYELISSGSGTERRALAQPAILLLHCTATHPDMADCMISEELIYTLASFLSLDVPSNYAGDPGTDPRLCSLYLLLRLMRLSSSAVEIVLRLGFMPKLEDLALDLDGSAVVKKKAAECLAVMCADKRKGCEVQVMLEKLIPSNMKGYGSWKMPLARIQDHIVDMKTLEHFLQVRHPSPWWTVDTPEGIESIDAAVPVVIVEASLSFAKARLSDFNIEAETVFRRSIAAVACVDMRDVRILRKRIGSVIIDFEVSFRKLKKDRTGAEISASLFTENLEKSSVELFVDTFLESMGTTKVTSVSLRHVNLSGHQAWQNGCSIPSSGDKNVIYVANGKGAVISSPQVPVFEVPSVSAAEVPVPPLSPKVPVFEVPPVSAAEVPVPPLSPLSPIHVTPPSPTASLPPPSPPSTVNVTLQLPIRSPASSVQPRESPATISMPPPSPPSRPKMIAAPSPSPVYLEVPPLPPPPPPPKLSQPSFFLSPRPPPPLPPSPFIPVQPSPAEAAHENGHSAQNGSNGCAYNGNGHARHANGTNGCTDGVKGAAAVTDGPSEHVTPEAESPSRTLCNSSIIVRSEEGRLVPLEKGLELALQGAEITKNNQTIAQKNFLEAFEEEPEELGRLVEKYPKLIQKFPLQPQLCYDLMAAWEENCLDLLSGDELTKHGRSIAAFDICRFGDPEAAAEEAKRKFQGILKIRREREWKEKSKQLKGDMSAELAKAVGERKEKLTVEIATDELKALSKGKIKTKKKPAQLVGEPA